MRPGFQGPVTDSKISIAELLDSVNEKFPDILPEDVLKHYGYDGIKDNGGKMGGEWHTVWIPFDSYQVKSADPVTYNDAGNVIPLSERFNESEKDIRYSDRDSFVDSENNEEYDNQKGVDYHAGRTSNNKGRSGKNDTGTWPERGRSGETDGRSLAPVVWRESTETVKAEGASVLQKKTNSYRNVDEIEAFINYYANDKGISLNKAYEDIAGSIYESIRTNTVGENKYLKVFWRGCKQ